MSSMKDVARLAEVSISTVSRVINQNIPVDQRTRQRVEDAIKKLNYRPNLLAKGLRLKSGNLIGLVVPDFVPLHAFAYIIKYIEESAARHDFNLILGNNLDNPDIEEHFIDSLLRRSVDGIIFSRVSDESRVLRILNKRNIPIVVIDRALEDEGVPTVVINNYRAGVLAAEHFISSGHRQIGCLTGPLNIRLCRERVKGFKDTILNHQLEFDDTFIFEGDFKLESGMKGAAYFRKPPQKITAIWAHNDVMAAGVMKELYKQGINVPQQMSVMGMDDIILATMMTPALTTIRQPFQAMSEQAVELILLQKHGQPILEKAIVLEPELIVRETTRQMQ
ncbi:MAG: LacI family DNA-binding transcriptional regulator [Candidatus Vecturithrix sp.]|nr:LacI family DNA-binding transcriptional regulator [Candidatus Vecturithrix sp.]